MTHYSSHTRATASPQTLESARLLVCGLSYTQVAEETGRTEASVKSDVKYVRQWLAVQGYVDVGNVIRLRQALRDEGFLDGVELL